VTSLEDMEARNDRESAWTAKKEGEEGSDSGESDEGDASGAKAAAAAVSAFILLHCVRYTVLLSVAHSYLYCNIFVLQ
jgi:hypothetical protein